MAKVPEESDVLVPFEIDNFPAEYRGYYGAKRYNMFAMIQNHRAMWEGWEAGSLAFHVARGAS